MILQQDALKAIELLKAYTEGVDTIIDLSNSDDKKLRKVVEKRTALQVYQSQKISRVYVEAKELISKY